MKRIGSASAWLLGAGLCLLAFHWLGARRGGFELRYVDARFIDTRELVFLVYCGVLGGAATLMATAGLVHIGAPAWLVRQVRTRPARMVAFAAVAATLLSLWLRHALLLAQPVADDELSYRFIAQTLLEGRVTNPLPLPAEFLKNQFAVISERGWFGKYPVGHPVLLALGMAAGAESLIVPLLGGLGVVLTYLVGTHWFGRPRAAVAACLLLISPQYIGTHATQLSQTSSMLCMLVGIHALLRLKAGASLGTALLAGLAFGSGILVRPMPGVLFVGVAAAAYLFDQPRPSLRTPGARQLREVLAGSTALALCVGVMLAVNAAQSGNAASSGYQVYHPEGLAPGTMGLLTHLQSLGGTALRQSFWLLGWPLVLLFIPLARPQRARVLFWGVITAGYAYRLLYPKTVVATTGPVYVMELVPLLVLALVDGLARACERLGARGRFSPPDWAAALLLAGAIASATCFLPVQARAIARGAQERAQVWRDLESAGLRLERERAVVFAFNNLLVFPNRRRTWAYYAPYPRPDLADPLLFLRAPPEDLEFKAVRALWQSRLADRRAFILLPSPQGAVIRELR